MEPENLKQLLSLSNKLAVLGFYLLFFDDDQREIGNVFHRMCPYSKQMSVCYKFIADITYSLLEQKNLVED